VRHLDDFERSRYATEMDRSYMTPEEMEEAAPYSQKGCLSKAGSYVLERCLASVQRQFVGFSLRRDVAFDCFDSPCSQDKGLLESWVANRQYAITVSKDAVRRRRKEEIERRLLVAGWLESE
jgi:hypothetical protein